MNLELNDLLRKAGIDPADVNVARHSPMEPALRRTLPWLASERRDLFEHFQSTHSEQTEKQLLKRAYLLSFLATIHGETVFAGAYERRDGSWIGWDDYWELPLTKEMVSLGQNDRTKSGRRNGFHVFQFTPIPDFEDLIGRLTVNWPTGSRAWVRVAGTTPLPICTLSEDNLLVDELRDWRDVDLSFAELSALPKSWWNRMSQWRGIYLITDTNDGKQYVGSAYGDDNILGRWLDYSKTGHGGNVRLKARDPRTYRFSVLELMSPDTEPTSVIRREEQWKKRLRTRDFGLNEN